MKISELIKHLESIKESHGDAECRIVDGDWFVDVEENHLEYHKGVLVIGVDRGDEADQPR